jgi:hypothetical protein
VNVYVRYPRLRGCVTWGVFVRVQKLEVEPELGFSGCFPERCGGDGCVTPLLGMDWPDARGSS